MSWKQVVPFDLNKMGRKSGYCLQNVRLGYGIPAKYASAKDAMNASKAAGTFHADLDIPTNVAVPIFAETGSPYGHVMVDYYGDVYSDGKHLSSLKGMTLLGWSETLNDVRVIEWQEDPKPAPTPAPSTGINVGDKVTLKTWVDYNGTPLRQTRDFYFVSQINGDRAVLNADSVNGAVYAAVNINNLNKVGDSPAPAPAPIGVGETVIVNGAGTASSNGSGATTRVYTDQPMKVIAIANDHYGCNQYNQDGGITGWWSADQVRRA